MKKIVIRLVIGVFIVLVLVVVALSLFLDRAVKRGVETVGSNLTQVGVKLDGVSLSLLSGSGQIKGLVVGNPEGFKSPSAIQVGTAALTLAPGSLLSEKVLIKSVRVEGPEITLETDLRGNNLSKILANLRAATNQGTNAPGQPTQTGSGKKLQVDDFLIRGGKVHVRLTTLVDKSTTVPLPDIQLSNLGQGPEGITSAELTRRVLEIVLQKAAEVSAGTVTELAKKAAADLTKDLDKSAAEGLDKVSKGLGDLLKKKK